MDTNDEIDVEIKNPAKPCTFWQWRYLNPLHVLAAANSNNLMTAKV